MSLLKLDTDCLLEIFSYLSPKDLLMIAKTCRRFTDIFPLCRIKTLNIFQYHNRPLWSENLDFMIKNVGHTMESLSCYGLRYIKLINKHCQQLKFFELRLESHELQGFAALKPEFIDLFSRLETLKLSYHFRYDERDCFDLNDYFPNPIPKMKSLCFDIYTLKLDGSFIKAPNLEELFLFGLNLTKFQVMLKSCPKLRRMKLKCSHLTHSDYFDFEEDTYLYIPLLESITFKIEGYSGVLNMNSFKKLKHLKEVKLYSFCESLVIDDFLTEICSRDQLHTFSTDLPIDFETVSIFSELKKLRTLKLYGMGIRDEHIQALYNNNFHTLALNCENVMSPELVVELPSKSENLEVLDLINVRCLKIENVEKMVTENPNINILYDEDEFNEEWKSDSSYEDDGLDPDLYFRFNY